MPTKYDPRFASSALTDARLAGQSLPAFPGDLPGSLEAAYAVQGASISRWPDRVAGWKVGGIPSLFQETYGEDRLAGPIFSHNVRYQNGGGTEMQVFDGGFAAVEAEYILKTASDILPGTVQPDGQEAMDLIADAFIGVEVASSPLRSINDLGPMCIISDFGNNGGLVVGKRIEGWRDFDFASLPIDVMIDGERVGHASAASLEEGPIAAFQFLLRNLAERDIMLPAGSFISTGAITGVHQSQVGASATADFHDLGQVHLELVATPKR